MEPDLYSEKEYLENEGFVIRCCGRLCQSEFDNNAVRPNSAVNALKEQESIDTVEILRGKWRDNTDFLFSVIGFAVGLGNIWRFPIRVYENGGGAFLLVYLVLSYVIGIPMLLAELGLGQFSSLGPTDAYQCVPILYGIGYTNVAISVFIVLYYCVIIAWANLYMFGSLLPSLPWTKCTNNFNTPNCYESLDTSIFYSNLSTKLASSSKEFYEYYVIGFNRPDGSFPEMSDPPGWPQWHLSLCLLLVWIVNGLCLMNGVRISGKIVYVTVIFPYLVIVFLVIRGISLEGSMLGITFYLKPNFYLLLKPQIYLDACEQLLFSLSIGFGGMITFSSFNTFHNNIFKDVVIVVLVDFITSFLAGFSVFSIIGYIAHRTHKDIDKVITSGPSLFFITFPDALATLPFSNFLTILIMLMAISLGSSAQFTMFECFSTALQDRFPVLRKTYLRKAITVLALSFIFFAISLIFVCPGGVYYFQLLDSRVTGYSLMIATLMEAIFMLLYGFKNLRLNFRMMLGYSMYWTFLIQMCVISPIIIFIILVANIIKYDTITINNKDIPVWGELLGVFFLVCVIAPILNGIFQTISNFRHKYPQLKFSEFITKLITPPPWWGPKRKVNWLLSSVYRQRLLLIKDDPKFREGIVIDENLDKIAGIAATLEKSFRYDAQSTKDDVFSDIEAADAIE